MRISSHSSCVLSTCSFPSTDLSSNISFPLCVCLPTRLHRHLRLATCYRWLQETWTDSHRQWCAALSLVILLTIVGVVPAVVKGAGGDTSGMRGPLSNGLAHVKDAEEHRLRATVQLYDHPGCAGDHIRKPFEIKEGHCQNVDDFLSLKAVPYKPEKYGNNFTERDCSIWYYPAKGCWESGQEGSLYSMTNPGGCLDTKFPGGGQPKQGRSFNLHCKTDLYARPTTKPINSVHTGTTTWTDPPLMTTTKTQVVTSIPTLSSSSPMATTTVTAISTLITQALSTPSASTTMAVTVPSMTTILAPPVATATGISTVWVPSPSGTTTVHKLSTSTYVYTDPAHPGTSYSWVSPTSEEESTTWTDTWTLGPSHVITITWPPRSTTMTLGDFKYTYTAKPKRTDEPTVGDDNEVDDDDDKE